MIRRHLWPIAFLGMALLLSGCASGYRPGGSDAAEPGYHDQLVGEGLWQVDFSTNGHTPYGYAMDGAMFRAAELARDAGYAYVQLIRARQMLVYTDGRPEPRRGEIGHGGERVEIVMRGVHDPAAPIDCQNPQGKGCFTLSTQKLLDRLAPVIEAGGRSVETGPR